MYRLLFVNRRLCPDISFFQQATEFPCDAVVNTGGGKRLHRRVEHSVLKSANVERKGLGITRVCVGVIYKMLTISF